MVGQRRVLVDHVREMVGGWGPSAGVRGLNLSDWNAQLHQRTHTHTHTQTRTNAHTYRHTAEYARTAQKFLEV